MHLNAAIWLTLFRILLIPILVILFYLPPIWSNWATAIVFSVAALTDWADGYVARRYDLASSFGAFLDPVADKLMVGVTLVVLVQSHPTPYFAIPAAIIVGREITVSALREWMSAVGKGDVVSVAMIGKVKTTFQMIAIILLLLNQDVWFISTHLLGHMCLWVAAVLTIWSMAHYVRAAVTDMDRSRAE